jgi:hypothetical protein
LWNLIRAVNSTTATIRPSDGLKGKEDDLYSSALVMMMLRGLSVPAKVPMKMRLSVVDIRMGWHRRELSFAMGEDDIACDMTSHGTKE